MDLFLLFKNIYEKANTKEDILNYQKMFNLLFTTYLNDIKNNNLTSPIFKIFLDSMNKEYLENTTSERKVIDFIAGMTDDYMQKCYLEIIDFI